MPRSGFPAKRPTKFPAVTLSTRTARELKRRRDLLSVETTFLTKDGPAVKSIWFDRCDGDRELLIVEKVERKVVHFVNGRKESVEQFIFLCDAGAYTLVGCIPPNLGYTVT